MRGDACKKSFEHLYEALYYRFSEPDCLDDINAAINEAPEFKKNYIRTRWLETGRL